MYFITENYEGLRKFVDEALELYPDVAEVYLYSAVADMCLGKFNSAEDEFATAMDFGIDVSPVVHNYWFYYGLYNYLLGNKEVAFDYFDKYYNNNQLDSYLLTRYVYCLVDSKKNMTLAGNLLIKVEKEQRNYYYFYYVRAYYNLVKGNIADAVSDIEKAISLKNDKSILHDLAGDIYKNNNDCASAVKHWQEAQSRGGNSMIINKKIQNCK